MFNWAVRVGVILMPLFAASWKEGFVKTSDGVRIHYVEAGSGPSIVFQPGWTMPAEIWEPQINELSKRFRVVAIDPRSQGKSDRPMVGHYPERRAQDIKEVIEQLKLAPAVLVGWSLGVAEVLAYVDQFGTGTLRGIVLVDGRVGKYEASQVAGLWTRMKQLQTERQQYTEEFVRSMYKTPQSPEYLNKITAAAASVPADSAVVLLASAYSSGNDWSTVLAKIDKPVLFTATASLKTDAALVRQKIPSARVEIFENAGHALFVDEAARFNTLLGEFAAGLK